MQDASPATYRTPSRAADTLRLSERLSARTLLLGSVMVVILWLFIGPEQDPDFWWHLRIGEWMVQNGHLPSTDIFTFTAANHVWTDHEYLTEILMWLTFNSLGLTALMITFALSCLELYWLRGYLSGRSLAIMYFPLVMVAWANLHGGWVIGLVWLGVALISELLTWAWEQDNPAHKMRARRLAVIGLASAVAVAATPHFLSLYPYPFQTQGSEAQQRLIVEWASPNFHNIELRPFEAMIFLLIVGFALKRPSVFDLLLALLAIGLALQNVRNIALFVAATTPVLINTYGAWWQELAGAHGWKPTVPPRPLFAAITAAVLLLIIGATSVRVGTSINPTRQDQLTASNYPVGAADWLAAHPEVGTRMFNQYGFGGYLAYRFYPEPNRRVFIFGEAALMGDDLLNEYADVYYVRSNWKQVLDRYGVDYVVENKGDPLPNLLATQPDWKLVYQDKVAVIYVRTPSRS